MKNLIVSTIITAMATTAMAGEMNDSPAPNLDLSNSVEVQAHFDWKQSDNKDESDFRTKDAEIKAQLMLGKQLKAVVKLELEQYFEDNGIVVLNSKSVAKAIEHAYLAFVPAKDGSVIAKVVFGKHRVAYGTDLAYTAMYQDGLYYDIARQDEVIGMTITLRPQTIIDQLSVSVFENGEGDLDIADTYGASFKAYKALSKAFVATLSGMWKETGAADDEYRVEIGLLYRNKANGITGYARGTLMENHPTFGDAYAAVIGLVKELGNGWGRAVLEGSYIEDYASQLTFAWLFNPFGGKNIQVGPEVRYTSYDNPVIIAGKSVTEDTTYGVRVTVRASSGKPVKKQLWRGDDANGPL